VNEKARIYKIEEEGGKLKIIELQRLDGVLHEKQLMRVVEV
jgi:hypothetical protein